jgi:hypothetical protein
MAPEFAFCQSDHASALELAAFVASCVSVRQAACVVDAAAGVSQA